MTNQPVLDADVAQAAATLAAGALRTIDMAPDADRLSDYALDVFWRIYEAMRVGVDVPVTTPPPVVS